MSQWRKILMAILPALLVLFMTMPATLVLAADDEGDSHSAETTAEESSDSHGSESTTVVAGSAEGAGIMLSLLALVLLVVVFVILLGAVGLGVIGVGYWQSMAD